MALVHGPIHGKQSKTFFGALGAPVSLLTAIGLIIAAMLLPVVQSSDATTTGYTIRRHEQQLADIDAQIYNTQADVAQLGSVARIHDQAARIGMVPTPTSAVDIAVSVPATNAVLLPRRYVPTPLAANTPPLTHSIAWKIRHALPLP